MKFSMRMKKSFALRSVFAALAFGFLFLGTSKITNGQTTTFAQFTLNPAGQSFIFTNNGTNATFETTPTTGVPINFNYSNIANLNAALTGTQSAKLFIDRTTTTASTSQVGVLLQRLNQTVTIRIIRDTAAPVGVGTGSRTNLLTAVISRGNDDPSIFGPNGSTSGNFNAATTSGNQIITFTSDFLTFSNTTERDLSLGFSSIQPALAVSGDYLRSFTASGVGTFASNPAPLVSGPPTAATVTISGRVLNDKGRGLPNTQVNITQADGSTRSVLTDNSGYYNFADIVIPQTIIVSVAAKYYTFDPQVVTLDSDFSGMIFVPNN